MFSDELLTIFKILLGLYISSYVISWPILITSIREWSERIRREGYIYKKREKPAKVKVIYELLKFAFQLAIPGASIYLIIRVFENWDKEYEDYKNQQIRDGYIVYNPDSKEKQQENTIDSQQTNFEASYQQMSIEEKLTVLCQEQEKLELYRANKEQIDAYYDYLAEYVKLQVENEILNQLSPIDIDNCSLEELQNLLTQIQNSQIKEEVKSPKVKQ